MSLLQQAAFLTSAADLSTLPPEGPPEVAFAGRSNVGKSSALNLLTGRKRLAYVSRTPGRTQTINFYSLGEAARLADLPGYGYARVPDALRRRWDTLAGGYLRSRASLAAVAALMDARRPFTAQDIHLVDWLRPRLGEARVRLLVLLTKSDKLARSARAAALGLAERRLAGLGVSGEVRAVSSLSREGADEARELLEGWLRDWRPAAGIKNPR
jgi:GTP-binding protein